MTKYPSADRFAAANRPLRHSPSGISGCRPRRAARRWLATNPAAAATARASAPTIAGDPQPSAEDSISPYTSAPSASTDRAVPARSGAAGRAGRPYRSRETTRSPAATVTAPSATLTQNPARQLATCVIAPPTTGPAASPTLATPAQTPTARARRAGSAYSVTSIDSVCGISAATPAACTARAPTRNPRPRAAAHAADPAVNTATPPRNAARRPTRAPTAPPPISSAAYTSEYSAATHASPAPDACSDTRISGSITFTTVALYIDSSSPRHSTASTAPDPGPRRPPAPAGPRPAPSGSVSSRSSRGGRSSRS